MESAQGGSKKKKRRVYVHVYEDTRERLKVIAALKGMALFDAMETILDDYVRGWQKLNKLDIDKMRDAAAGKAPRKTRAKR